MIQAQPATAPSYRGGSSLRAVGVCAVLAAISTFVLLSDRPGLYALVLVLLAVVAAPTLSDWNRRRLDYFEPIHAFGLIYFIYFGLGSIWTVQDPKLVAYDRYIEPYLAPSLIYCIVGYAALLGAYYGSRKISLAKKPRAMEMPTGTLFLLVAGGLGLLGHLAAGAWDVASGRKVVLPAIISSLGQFSPLFLFTWALAWMLYFGRRADGAQRRVLFYFLVPSVVIIGFMNFANKTLALTLIGVPVIALWYGRRKVAWRTLLTLVLLMLFVVFPLYNAYRWSNPRFSRGERFSATIHRIQEWDSSQYMRFSLGGFKRRMALINSVAVVVRDTGRHVPYAKGEFLMTTLAFFIPRAVWKDKPTADLGRRFGQTFRVTSSLTQDTYIAATAPGELYWNFGLAGIAFGMAGIGFAMQFFYRRYGCSPGLDPVQRAVYVLLLARFVRLESSLALNTATIIRTLVLLEVIRWTGRRSGLLSTEDPV